MENVFPLKCQETDMKKGKGKAWLYLLPAFLFLSVFLIYPLFDVIVYSLQEGYNSASQSYFGIGLYNFSYVLRDPYFMQAVKNTFLLVVITVPLSTGIALLIALGLNSIKRFKDFFQTVFCLPYVTNTIAVGLVFMILFQKTPYSDGFVNVLIQFFGEAQLILYQDRIGQRCLSCVSIQFGLYFLLKY
jgi:multiple sugar transport system permease protein